MYKIGDKVKVEVLTYRLIGEIIKIENDIATIEVSVYYGKGNQKCLTVERRLQDLWGVIKDLKDYEKHQGMWNLK